MYVVTHGHFFTEWFNDISERTINIMFKFSFLENIVISQHCTYLFALFYLYIDYIILYCLYLMNWVFCKSSQ
jgi:hypothetical protein